jgi:hypothetical protein
VSGAPLSVDRSVSVLGARAESERTHVNSTGGAGAVSGVVFETVKLVGT